jgi:hypothetical protein
MAIPFLKKKILKRKPRPALDSVKSDIPEKDAASERNVKRGFRFGTIAEHIKKNWVDIKSFSKKH